LTGDLPPNQDPNASDKGCATRYEYFIKDSMPKKTEVLKMTVPVWKDSGKLAPMTQTEGVDMQEKQVLKDAFGSYYCIDCNNDAGPSPTPKP
jgi:hypothetical protein